MPEMLTTQSPMEDSVRVINAMQSELFTLREQSQNEIFGLKQQIAALQAQQSGGGGHGSGGPGSERLEEMTRWRSISSLPKFNGDEKIFKDFDFKLHQFVRPVPAFEKFLDWIKEADAEPDVESMADYKMSTGAAVEYLNDQLYGILSTVSEGDALQTMMNVSESHDTRGAQSWYRLTREASGKTGARLKRLSAKVHRPSKIADYKNALAQLTAWDTSLKELVKVEGQGLSELTKITTLSNMVPDDLMRDVEKDKSLVKLADIWNYVIEQVEVRKHWAAKSKKDPNAMDIDAAEDESLKDEIPACGACEGEDLDTLKGGGRQVFNGYCGYCNLWGHKRAECRKRASDMAKGGSGKDGGKGKEVGKGQEAGKGSWGQGGQQQQNKGGWKGGWQQQSGGWQTKGGSGKGKGKWGKQGGKGSGFGGTMYNIDGDDGYYDSFGGGWGSSGANSSGFFGCLCESDSDGESDIAGLRDREVEEPDQDLCGFDVEEMCEDNSKLTSVIDANPPEVMPNFHTIGDYWNYHQARPYRVVCPTGEIVVREARVSQEKEVASPATSLSRATLSPITPTTTSYYSSTTSSSSTRITTSQSSTAQIEKIPKLKGEIDKLSDLIVDKFEKKLDFDLGDVAVLDRGIRGVELNLSGVDELNDDDFGPAVDAGIFGHKLMGENLLDSVPKPTEMMLEELPVQISEVSIVPSILSGEYDWGGAMFNFDHLELVDPAVWKPRTEVSVLLDETDNLTGLPDEDCEDDGGPCGLVDSSDDEDGVSKSTKAWEERQRLCRQRSWERQRFLREPSKNDPEGNPPVDGSIGDGLPMLTKLGLERTINTQDAQRQTPEAKPKKSAMGGRRIRCKHRRNLAKLNHATGEFEKLSERKNFEKYTIGELKEIVDGEPLVPPGLPLAVVDANSWMDQDLCIWEDDGDKSADLLGFSWRSDTQTWDEKKWVKVDSVVDSGACSPVAPPNMLPGVKVEPSPGSIRGQNYTSASKHKVKNLGQQRIKACTEAGDETEVLFQIADVSKPLVSVGSICERGNRVLFGRSGGVVQNLRTGKEIPFYRRNGIYVLSLWLMDGDQGFTRP